MAKYKNEIVKSITSLHDSLPFRIFTSHIYKERKEKIIQNIPYLKRAHECFVDGHHPACVIELAAVIRCGEEGDKLTFCEEFVAILYNLMCTTNQVKIVPVEKFAHHIRAKGEGNSTVILRPALYVFIRIRPQQIAQQTWGEFYLKTHSSFKKKENYK